MAQYQVAFSYASTRADYVRDVASRVQQAGYRVFFDELQRAEFYRKNLWDELTEIYKKAPLSVLFLSSDYEKSSWCKIERQAAQDRDGTVLVGRFDDSPVTGINANDWAARLNHVPGDFAAIIVTELRKLDVRPEDSGPSAGELEYGLGFGPAGFRIAYLPARGAPWQEHYDERPLEKLTLEIDRTPFELPQRYQAWEPARHGQNLPRCRLVSYSIGPEEMRLTLSRTSYEDYLRSGELIDFMRAPGSDKTLRAHFLTTLQRDRGYLEPFSELTNICGVGIFVITRDNKLVSTKHSDNSHVYPGRRTFAASGTMPWGAWPHPYTAVLQKAHDEIQHLVDPKKVTLFAFGVDARKLYFQFSFVEERTDVTFEELRTHYEQSGALSRNPRGRLSPYSSPPSRCADPWSKVAGNLLQRPPCSRFSKTGFLDKSRRRSRCTDQHGGVARSVMNGTTARLGPTSLRT